MAFSFCIRMLTSIRLDRPLLDHHKGLRPRVVIGQGHVNDRLMPRRRHRRQPVRRPPRQMHPGLSGAKVAHGHVLPGDSHAQPRPKRLGTGLFRGPPFGISARHILPPLGFLLLGLGEDPVAKPVPKPLQRAGNAVDIGQIGADPEDHRASPIRLKTRGNLPPKPRPAPAPAQAPPPSAPRVGKPTGPSRRRSGRTARSPARSSAERTTPRNPAPPRSQERPETRPAPAPAATAARDAPASY